MTEPIACTTTRYRCPSCSRSHSSKTRCRMHMARCWYNPDAKGCKTCKHFDNTYEDYGEDCDVGVDLSGRPACQYCGGMGYVGAWDSGEKCPECKGEPEEIRSGPITGCDKWESKNDNCRAVPTLEGAAE